MTRTAFLPIDVAKEIRALAVPWLVCLTGLAAAGLLEGIPAFRSLWIPAYILGAASLGAFSIGQEYSHGTLHCLLSQPAPRERVFLVKLGVLAAMLLSLYAVAAAVAFDDVRDAPQSETLAFGLLPVFGGLFVAPWLTMACRSPIAGTVFTVALPGIILTGTQVLYVLTYGRAPATAFEMSVLVRGTLLLCAVGAVMSWRAFMQLEAIDGRGPQGSLLQRLGLTPLTGQGASNLRKQRPIWLLVNKELRLQSMAFVIAGLYSIGWLAFISLGPPGRDPSDEVLSALTFFYGALVSMLIGSLASAEERQLGTLEWQALLPVAMSTQWAVKVCTALGLALMLALGWPALLVSLNPGMLYAEPVFHPQIIAGVLVLTSVSLYVSTLSTDGLRALLMSVPVVFAALVFFVYVVQSLASSVLTMTARLSGERIWQRVVIDRIADGGWGWTILELVIVAAILAVLVRFASANHRSAERAAGRAWTQVILLAVCLTTGTILLAGMLVLF